MADLPPFPDMESALPALLDDIARTTNRTPKDWGGNLPWNRVTVFGGTDDGITDVSRFDVDSFGSTLEEARDVAELTRQRLTARGGHVVAGVAIDQVITQTRPHYVKWTDTPPPYRYTATYTASARRTAR